MNFSIIREEHEEPGIVADKAHDDRGGDAPWQAWLRRRRRGGSGRLSVHLKGLGPDPFEMSDHYSTLSTLCIRNMPVVGQTENKVRYGIRACEKNDRTGSWQGKSLKFLRFSLTFS